MLARGELSLRLREIFFVLAITEKSHISAFTWIHRHLCIVGDMWWKDMMQTFAPSLSFCQPMTKEAALSAQGWKIAVKPFAALSLVTSAPYCCKSLLLYHPSQCCSFSNISHCHNSTKQPNQWCKSDQCLTSPWYYSALSSSAYCCLTLKCCWYVDNMLTTVQSVVKFQWHGKLLQHQFLENPCK